LGSTDQAGGGQGGQVADGRDLAWQVDHDLLSAWLATA
jgi:hypothetical protein